MIASNVELSRFQSSTRIGAVPLGGPSPWDCVSRMSRSPFGNGSGLNSTASSAENTAPFAPIASANVSTTVNVKPGERSNERHA